MKYVLLLVFVLILGTAAFVLGWLGGEQPVERVTAPVPEIEPEAEYASELMDEASAAEEANYTAITVEYKKLEKARRNLDRRLAHMKAVMWNVELPAEQAGEIVGKIRKAYELLKTKKLLGAFSGLQSVSDELARVEFSYQNLEGVEEEIKAAKAQP